MMKTSVLYYLLLFLFISYNEPPIVEKMPAIHLDFEAAKAYFKLVEKLQNGHTISEEEWDDFFHIEGNLLYLTDYKYTKADVESLKKSIRDNYRPKKDSIANQEMLQKELTYHQTKLNPCRILSL